MTFERNWEKYNLALSEQCEYNKALIMTFDLGHIGATSGGLASTLLINNFDNLSCGDSTSHIDIYLCKWYSAPKLMQINLDIMVL